MTSELAGNDNRHYSCWRVSQQVHCPFAKPDNCVEAFVKPQFRLGEAGRLTKFWWVNGHPYLANCTAIADRVVYGSRSAYREAAAFSQDPIQRLF